LKTEIVNPENTSLKSMELFECTPQTSRLEGCTLIKDEDLPDLKEKLGFSFAD
jgi:hypothetical protein